MRHLPPADHRDRASGHARQRRGSQSRGIAGEQDHPPFSDFLLHHVGTGDGIVQNGGPSTQNKMRTPPLSGLRFRGRLMHHQLSFSLEDAMRRHGNQAASSRFRFNESRSSDKRRLLAFLESL